MQRRNRASCQNGLANCDPLSLTEADLNLARTAFHERNVEACKKGLPSCDPSLLNGPEMASAVAAFQQRRSRLEQLRQPRKQ
jgi:hypothetical protein